MKSVYTLILLGVFLIASNYEMISQDIGIFKVTVQNPEGEILYCKMNIYNPETLEIIKSQNVGNSGKSFTFILPIGKYKIYTRPFDINPLAMEFDIEIKSFETLDTILVIPERTQEKYFDNLYSSKSAVFKGGEDQFFLRIEIDPKFKPEKIFIFNEFNVMTSSDGNQIMKFEFNDDGLNNDEKADDGIYTSENIGVGDSVVLYRQNKIGSVYLSQFQLIENGKHSHYQFNESLASEIAVTDKSVDYGKPVKLAEDIYANDYIVNVVRPDTVPEGYGFEAELQHDMKVVLEHFPDEFDFMFEFKQTKYSKNNIHHDIYQNVQNIGSELVDERNLYGPTQRLKGGQLFSGKTPSMPLQHELLHQWGNDMHELFGNPQGHNGYTSIWGVHGGFDMEKVEVINDTLIRINEGAYSTNGTADLFAVYADLELYNMGLIDFSELREEYYSLKDVVDNWDGTLKISGIDTIKKQEIIDFYGERIPSFEDSQKDFTSVFVVSSQEPISDAMFAFYTYVAKGWDDLNEKYFAYKSFAESTGYRGTMTTKLPPVITSVEPIEALELIISPNPATDNFTIELPKDNSNVYQLKIYDIEGKLVHSSDIKNIYTLNKKLLKGVYSIVLTDRSNNKISKKLIVK